MAAAIVSMSILILLAYFLGLWVGKKKREPQVHSPEKLREAWQEGYEAATNYLKGAGASASNAAQTPQQFSPPYSPAQPQAGPVPAVADVQTPALATPPATESQPPQPTIATVPATTAPIAPAKPLKVLSKRERELRNINITLYVAALMIVGAAALFLSFALTPNAKVVSLCVLAVLFYVAGLVTHASKSSLRPAGAAFAGTGLALLPLCAIATYNTANLSGPTVWMIYSAISTLAVGYATIRLRSQVLAWMAVLILISTSMAGAAMMQRGLLYYFVFLLVLSVILMLLATMSARVRSSQFYTAVSGTAQAVPLLVALMAVVLLPEMRSRDYLWIFALLTAQLLLAVRLLPNLRLYRWYGARVSFMLTVFAACAYLGFSVGLTAMILAVLFAGQAAVVGKYDQTYREKLQLSALMIRNERLVLWGAALVGSFLTYLLENQDDLSFWVSYVAIPVMMICSLPELFKGSRIEAGVVLAFTVLSLLDTVSYFWRPLAAVTIAIAVFVAVRGKADGSFARFGAYARCLLIALAGFVIGGSVWQVTDGFEVSGLTLGAGAGLLISVLGYWIYTAFGPLAQRFKPQDLIHQLIRLGASMLTAVLIIIVWKTVEARAYRDIEFLGLDAAQFIVFGLVLTAVVAFSAGFKLNTRAAQATQYRDLLRGSTVLIMSLLFALAFSRAQWVLLLIIGGLALLFFLGSMRSLADERWRIIYAAMAQVIFSVSVWWLIDNLDVDLHGHYALVLLSVVLPQLARLVRSARSGQAPSLELQWITMGLLVGEPVSVLGYSAATGEPDRGVLMLFAVLWGVHAWAGARMQRTELIIKQFFLLALVAATMMLLSIPAAELETVTGWIRTQWYSPTIACLLLIALAAVALILELRLRAAQMLSIATSGAIILPLGLVLLWQADRWVAVLALCLAALASTLLVRSRTNAWFALGAVSAIALAMVRIMSLVRHGSGTWRIEALEMVWALLANSVICYLLATASGRWKDPVPNYPDVNAQEQLGADPHGGASRLYFASTLLTALVAGFIAHVQQEELVAVIGGAVLVVGTVFTAGQMELPTSVRIYLPDAIVALAATLALSSYSQLDHLPHASIITLYFCAVAVVLAGIRILKADAWLERNYLLVAAALASLSLVLSLFESLISGEAGSLSQVLALIFFAALVAWSLKRSDKVLIWWAAVAITLSILWFLRGLAFLWLVLLGLGLIAAAIYKLVKVDPSADRGASSTPFIQPDAPTSAQPPTTAPGLPWQRPNQPQSPQQDPEAQDLGDH